MSFIGPSVGASISRTNRLDTSSSRNLNKLPLIRTLASTPTRGDLCYNTDSNTLYFGDGSVWVNLTLNVF